MYGLSAAKSSQVSFVPTEKSIQYEPANDSSMSGIMVIHVDRDKDSNKAYALDPKWILQNIKNDTLNNVVNLTIPTRPVGDGVGLWQTIINLQRSDGVSSCFNIAAEDFSPIGDKRSAWLQFFLDYTKRSSRISLQRLVPGDKIGVSVYDARDRQTYVLLFKVTGFCLVPETSDIHSRMVTCANLSMQRFYVIQPSGEGTSFEVDDTLEDSPMLDKFVAHLNAGAGAITRAWAWTPHFTPKTNVEFKADIIQERLLDILANSEKFESTYDDFEEAARRRYEVGRKKRIDAIRQRPVKDGKERKRAPKIVRPVVQIALLADERIVATFGQTSDSAPPETFIFPIDSIGSDSLVETYLLNKDLSGDVFDNRDVLHLDYTKFGENSTVRWLDINY